MPPAEPFGPPIPDVRLAAPPLVKVLAQVRFPDITSIAQSEFIGPFQEALRGRYPVLRKEQELGLLLTPDGPAATPQSGFIWRFADKEGQWQVALGTSFIALETGNYTGQGEFMERLRHALESLGSIGAPVIFDRFGLRYVNRIRVETIEALRPLVRAEVLGLLAGHLLTEGASVEHAISQARFAVHEGALQTRWGFLPANVSLDATIPPADESTWVLDLDMSVTGPGDFEVGQVMNTADLFHARIYRFFRWAVTDEFLRMHGGQI